MDVTALVAEDRDLSLWGAVLDTLFPVMGWTGFVLLGLAVLMTLLDWGELSGPELEASRRRGPSARTVAICGVVLGVVGIVGSMVR